MMDLAHQSPALFNHKSQLPSFLVFYFQLLTFTSGRFNFKSQHISKSKYIRLAFKKDV